MLRAAAFASTLALAAWGSAHPDVPVADTSFRLEAGEARSFPLAVHYHRLVGQVRSEGAGPSDLDLRLVPWAAEGSGNAAAPREAVSLASPREGLAVLNHLIRCCEAGYTDYRLIVENRGGTPRAVELRAWAVHDDFAVVVDRAEAGAFGVPATIFGVLSAIALAVTYRRRSARTEPDAGPASRALPWSVALTALALAVAATLGLAGTVRYGGDPVTGMMAVLADVPVPGGPFGSRAALVMGVLLLAWCGAVGAWIRAAAVGRSRAVPTTGVSLGLISIAGGIAMGLAYGALLVPVALGLILGAPLLLAGWWCRDRSLGSVPVHADR